MSQHNKNIILTGGLGFIGSHVFVELNDEYNVIIVDDLSNSNIDTLDQLKTITKTESISFYHCDINNEQNLDDIFKIHPPYAVIHFAGYKAVGESVQNPIKYYDNNINSTLTLLKCMENHNCFRMIFSSSATVYGSQIPPLVEDMQIGVGITNPYGQTKFMIERILEDVCVSNDKWNITSLRYFNPVGAHSSGLIGESPNGIPNNLMPFVLKVAVNNNTTHHLGDVYNALNIFGGDYDTADGTCIRDYIHVVDLAKGHLCALREIDNQKRYNVFNIGTGDGSSVLDIVNTFEKVNCISIPYMMCERRQGDLSVCFCNGDKAKEELGWVATHSIEDMCRDSWNFQKRNI